MSLYKGNKLISGGLPNQTGKAGKYLKTDGAHTSWEAIDESPSKWGIITGNIEDQTDLQNALNNKVAKNNTITGATKTKITYDSKGLVTAGTDLIESDIPNLHLNKISDVTSTAQEINYLNGVTSNVQTQISGKLNITDVINNITTTTTNQALSANMGKELQDQITNLKQRGRYLSIWNCTTGLAETTPTVDPYNYKAGDYFLVGTVASQGGTNYRPNGSTYSKDVPSTTVETGTVIVNDAYYYDGTSWTLLHTEQPTIAFSTLAGSPYDNANLTIALNAKVSGNNAITGATKCKITYDAKGLVTSGMDLAASDIPNLTLSKITDITVTATELNYSDGVTSNIQTQLNAKQPNLTSVNAGDNITINTSSESHNLPAEYQEVEYIQSDGTQYINTGLSANNKTLYLKTQLTSSTNNQSLFGQATEGGQAYEDFFFAWYDNSWYYGRGGTSMGHFTGASYNTLQTIVYNNANGNIEQNGTTYNTNITNSTTSTGNLAIFARKETSSVLTYCSMKLYYFKMYNKATSTYDLEMYPCYRKSDNVAGLYDKVNGVFYDNDGTGTFSVGPNITNVLKINALSGLTSTVTELNYVDGVTSNIQTQLNAKQPNLTSVNAGDNITITAASEKHGLPIEYQELVYIQSSGSQYINTGLSANNKTLYLKAQLTDATNEQSLFGYSTFATGGLPYEDYFMTWYSNAWYYGKGSTSEGYFVGEPWSSLQTIIYNNVDGNIEQNGTVHGTNITNSTTNTGSLVLFARRLVDNVGTYAIMRLYYFKMYNRATSTYDLEMYPCYRKSDGVIGMYDKVTSTFFTNAGSSNFIAGPIVGDDSLKINALQGLTSTVTELNYSDGVTSNIQTQLNNKEATTNKVTAISSSSTDTQYPSAKCVYDIVGNIEATLQAIRGV